jgi:hypothetical protein
MLALMRAMTSLSKHFMMTEVTATERQSFGHVSLFFLGTETMVISLNQQDKHSVVCGTLWLGYDATTPESM